MNQLNLDMLTLRSGWHTPNDEQRMCAMEAVAWLAGEPWTDHPQCASPVIAKFIRSWNDTLNDEDRQQLKQHIPTLIGSAASPDIEERRSWMAADWLIRTFTPTWLRLAGLDEGASALAEAEVVSNTRALERAIPLLDAARAAARAAARDAAGAAARAAARDAVGDAVGAAAWAAAGAAARAAAGAAAMDAAWDVAWAAAMDAGLGCCLGPAAMDAAWDAAWAAAGAAAWAAAGAAARDAAWAAARAAAGAAAMDAAWDVAWAVAWAAAGAAARDAARDAVGAAAWAAAGDAVRPTVEELQKSAHDLIRRMIEVGS